MSRRAEIIGGHLAPHHGTASAAVGGEGVSNQKLQNLPYVDLSVPMPEFDAQEMYSLFCRGYHEYRREIRHMFQVGSCASPRCLE